VTFWRVLTSYPTRVPLLTLDIVARYQAGADSLNKIRASIAHAQIYRYRGDYALLGEKSIRLTLAIATPGSR